MVEGWRGLVGSVVECSGLGGLLWSGLGLAGGGRGTRSQGPAMLFPGGFGVVVVAAGDGAAGTLGADRTVTRTFDLARGSDRSDRSGRCVYACGGGLLLGCYCCCCNRRRRCLCRRCRCYCRRHIFFVIIVLVVVVVVVRYGGRVQGRVGDTRQTETLAVGTAVGTLIAADLYHPLTHQHRFYHFMDESEWPTFRARPCCDPSTFTTPRHVM